MNLQKKLESVKRETLICAHFGCKTVTAVAQILNMLQLTSLQIIFHFSYQTVWNSLNLPCRFRSSTRGGGWAIHQSFNKLHMTRICIFGTTQVSLTAAEIRLIAPESVLFQLSNHYIFMLKVKVDPYIQGVYIHPIRKASFMSVFCYKHVSTNSSKTKEEGGF